MRYKSRYMRQRSRSYFSVNTKKNFVTILIIAALGVAIFSIGAIGDFMARKVFLPLLGDPSITSEPTPTKTPSASKKTENISTPELALYYIQLGAYNNKKTAQDSCSNVTARGGAGYIIEDEYFRVMASAYNTEEQAKSVVQQLETQGMEAKIHPVKSGTVVFKITASQSQIDLINEAFEKYPDVCKQLVDNAIKVDKGEITEAAYRNLCNDQAKELKEIRTRLEGATANKEPGQILTQLIELYKNAEIELDNIYKLNSISDLAFSSKIKYNYMQLAMWYCDYIALVSNS